MIDLRYNRKLILEDGEEYRGFAFGYAGEKVLEIVFNTSVVGYQELLSDPSYTDQAVVMTSPLIGNYGMAADDDEAAVPTIGAMIVREYNDAPSNFRSERTLAQAMEQSHISGISGIDTPQAGPVDPGKGHPQMPAHRCGHRSGGRSGKDPQHALCPGRGAEGQLPKNLAVRGVGAQISCGRH